MGHTQGERVGRKVEHLDALTHSRRQHGLGARETVLIYRRDKSDGQCVRHLGNQVFNARQGRILRDSLIDGHLLAPTLQVREIHLHLTDVFLPSDGLW